MNTLLYDFRDWFFTSSKNEKVLITLQVLLIIWLILFFLSPSWFEFLRKWNGGAIPKMVIWSTVIIYIQEIFEKAVTRFRNYEIAKPEDAKNEMMLIDGKVPVDELVDFLLTEQSFKIEKVKERRGVTNDWCKKLGNNLERVLVLGRGEDNSRILITQNIRYIIEVLSSSPNSDLFGVYSDTWVDYLPLT